MLIMSTYFSPLPSRQCNPADVIANIFLRRIYSSDSTLLYSCIFLISWAILEVINPPLEDCRPGEIGFDLII